MGAFEPVGGHFTESFKRMDNLFREAAEYQTGLARHAVRTGNSPGARKAYSIAVRAWRKAIEIHPSLINYLLSTEREYLRLVRTDGVYREILGAIKQEVSCHPGILQTDLYTRVGRFHRADLETVLEFAVRAGEISRRKRGSASELYVMPDRKGIPDLLVRLSHKLPFHRQRIERRLPAAPPA
jgi:hypothetical protein